MTQEDKELLLQDLSARLPYGVICNTSKGNGHLCSINQTIFGVEYGINIKATERDYFDNEEIIKPYLFPLSSITEGQYNSLHELGILNNCSHSYEYVNPHIYGASFIFKEFKTYSLELIEWLNKNHFDYRGLITNDLAIDATGLNIY